MNRNIQSPKTTRSSLLPTMLLLHLCIVAGPLNKNTIQAQVGERSGGDELPEYLISLFGKLQVQPRLQTSVQRQDLSDLFRPNPDMPGEYICNDGIVVHKIGTTVDEQNGADKRADVLIYYQATKRRNYVEHVQQFFGPYNGNVYDLLPEIEQGLLHVLRNRSEEDMLRAHKGLSWKAILQLQDMLQTQDVDAATRVLGLIDKAMHTKYRLDVRNNLNRSLRRLIQNDAEMFARIPDQQKLNTVRQRLRKFFGEIDAMRTVIPATDYITTESSQIAAPKTVAEELWGPTVDGLRFAIVPDKRSIARNEICVVKTVVQNVGDTSIKFGMETNGQISFPKVKLDAGRTRGRTSTIQPPFVMDDVPYRYVVKPGEMIAIGESKLQWIPEPKGRFPNAGVGTKTVLLTQESMQENVIATLNLSLSVAKRDSWNRKDDGELEIILPAKDEWSGELSAGGFEILLETQ